MIVLLCRRSKRNYLSFYFSSNLKNLQKVWLGINSIISMKSKKSSPVTLTINDTLTSDVDKISIAFNNYFSNIAENIRKSMPTSYKYFSSFMPRANRNSFFLSPVDPTEVIHCISSFKLSKSSGPNSIPSKILSLLKFILSEPLANLINLSFTTGIFPSKLKFSKVIPVHKKGSLLEISNYRPISLLSNIDKIYEKLIHKRLYNFLNVNNILYENQFGFRKGFSTSHALLSIVQKISDHVDKGEFACGIFVDLQKAFDTVDHNILLKKFQFMGFVAPLSHYLNPTYLIGNNMSLLPIIILLFFLLNMEFHKALSLVHFFS